MAQAKAQGGDQMAAYSKMMSIGNDMMQEVSNKSPNAPGNFLFEVEVKTGSPMMIDQEINGTRPAGPGVGWSRG